MVAVSVLIRTIGRKAALKDALDSLVTQTFKDFEVVIVEDGAATLADFLSAYSALAIRYEASGVHKGRSAAGNRALALSQGEYCIFLDEDDLFYPDHLQRLHAAVTKENASIVYSFSEERAVERAPDGNVIRKGRRKRYRYEPFSLLNLVAGNFIPINAVLFHRSFFEKAGGFDEDMDCLEDWLLWLRYAAIEPKWRCVPHITAIYHVPFNKRARRKGFRAWHDKVRKRMRHITFLLDGAALADDIRNYFGIAVFLRKLYYYIFGFIRR